MAKKKKNTNQLGCFPLGCTTTMLIILIISGLSAYYLNTYRYEVEYAIDYAKIKLGIVKEYHYQEDNKARSNSIGHHYLIKGIDISHHQGFISWDLVKKSNIRFAYIKATQGLKHKDKRFRGNYKYAQKNGIKVGFYHFFSLDKDGAKQALHLLSTTDFASNLMPYAVDIEYFRSSDRKTDFATIKKRRKEIHRFDSTMFVQTGKHPIIYTQGQCYTDLIQGHFLDCPLWICDWQSTQQPNTANRHWTLWQYTDKGKIDGIYHNNVDLNVFRGGEEDFELWSEGIIPK